MADNNKEIEQLKKVFEIEGNEISKLTSTLDFDVIADFCNLIDQTKGKIILTGCGTSAMAAKKAMHTLNVIGISAFFLSPSDAVHGALGAVKENDVVIFISKGGSTKELTAFLPNVKEKKAKIVAITEKKNSKIAQSADIIVPVHVEHEADSFNMLATASTLAVISLFDAIAVTLMGKESFTKDQFLVNHPSGDVGERLEKGIK
ncbi:MAG: SIS domain-containing protein [Liquorilactobacillus hordei]|uniref:Phosphosugar isomerase n=1 Tax=Liquorilactobacillus hordei TaxID=468911 RepID=A0A3Q8CA75_9LACO|nr:SIS domain-containing protein [Liquorilactobacillus hordei]AUJ30444.1 phosphosugar isomerase [Liquorilactobacillus hordei]